MKQTKALGLAETILEMRTARDIVFGSHWFADPAWDMLLEVYVAESHGRSTQLQSMCSAARVPRSTGDRVANRLVKACLLVKEADPDRKGGVRLRLSPEAEQKIGRLLERAFLIAERHLRSASRDPDRSN